MEDTILLKLTKENLLRIICIMTLPKSNYYDGDANKVMKFEAVMRGYIKDIKDPQKDINVILNVADQILKDLK